MPFSHTLRFHNAIDESELGVAVQALVIAGWTGRDRALVQRHIDELAAIGVTPPPSTPVFYRAAAQLLTPARSIEVLGEASSGEVEFFLLSTPRGTFVGVGSDHTDRKVETYDITVSKQVCAKPIGPGLWPLEALLPHWDSLVLRSYSTSNGIRRLYQEGPVSSMLHPLDLVLRYTRGASVLPPGTLMFCGTLPMLGGVAAGERFEIALDDLVNGRRLEHAYDVRSLAYVEER